MLHSKTIATFLYGALLSLTSAPSMCLSLENRTASIPLNKVNGNNVQAGEDRRNQPKSCVWDATNRIKWHAGVANVGIPFDFDPESAGVLESYVNSIRDCALSFLNKLHCETIREDILSARNVAPKMTGRITQEKRGSFRGAEMTPAKCCQDAHAIRRMAEESIKSIESSWMPDEDGAYDFETLEKMLLDLDIFDEEKRRFTSTMEAVGSVYIRELDIKPDPICYSSGH
eukprot:CAMPEP_0197433312 /NCGR_PEP_ID=MMETSP1175-20131217/1232_1 /TAXON_ID=1003142 /ORGANISM="Triceratium dubium, Strain CCMP147" /LENGTH=228 /DNA_ID=CAMNT_0042961655 /DNA_START=81 /DNA_END=767 /DNA_ORIENTATION=+